MRRLLFLLATLVPVQTSAEHLVEQYYRRVGFSSSEEASAGVVIDLLTRAAQWTEDEPENTDAWLGVIRAAYAKRLGTGGRSQLKQARAELERSIALDADWRDGYAMAFLARLYVTVPGWPISFGSDQRGARMLAEVVVRHPVSLAGDLYEGLRLLDARATSKAAVRLEAASKGTLGCDCPHWINTLRSQAREGLDKLE